MPSTTTLPSTAERPAFLDGFAFVHAAMRRDADRLPLALAAADDQALQAIGRWFARFEREIEHHHQREDKIVWDEVVARAPGFAAERSRLEQDHEQLDAAMSELRAALARTGAGAAAAAVPAAERFRALLHDHLDREEAAAFPTIADAFSEEGWAEIEQRLLDQSRAVAGVVPQLVSPYRNGVKWYPSDHRCVAGELLAAEPIGERWAIKGEIVELQLPDE